MKPVTEFLTGPVTYDREGQMFFCKQADDHEQMVGELRGWGRIQKMFMDKKGAVNFKAAADFQDELGEWIADAINMKLENADLIEKLKIAEHEAMIYKTQVDEYKSMKCCNNLN